MASGNLSAVASQRKLKIFFCRPGLLVIVALFLFLAACSSKADLEQPPEIRYGEDVCDRCSMIINEARFAAAYVTAEDDTLRFDDIGGMLSHAKETGDDVSVYWVHDYETEEWLKADSAFFVAADDLHTPMGFGIIAFTTEEKAESWAESDGGTAMTFSELMARDIEAKMIGHDE